MGEENDFWDLDSQDLNVANINAEIERMGEGEKISLLNVSKEHLVFLTAAISVYGEMAGTQQEVVRKVNKMRDELLDAIQRLAQPSHGGSGSWTPQYGTTAGAVQAAGASGSTLTSGSGGGTRSS